jgi:hypothetical protein
VCSIFKKSIIGIVIVVAVVVGYNLFKQISFYMIESEIRKCDGLIVSTRSWAEPIRDSNTIFKTINRQQYDQFAELIDISDVKTPCKCRNYVYYTLFRNGVEYKTFDFHCDHSIEYPGYIGFYMLEEESVARFDKWKKQTGISKKIDAWYNNENKSE